MVVHDVLHSIFRTVFSNTPIVGTTEQVPLPFFPCGRLQQPTRCVCLELVSVVSILLHEREHLIQIDVNDDWGQLANPGQSQPKIVFLKTKTGHSLLQLWQRLLVVLLCKGPDVLYGLLLTVTKLGRLLEFGLLHDHFPVGLSFPVDACRSQLGRDRFRVGTLMEIIAQLLLDALLPLLKEFPASTHLPNILLKLVEGYLSAAVRIDHLQ
mmetsp:Transcript_51553/g.123536  ORF Transcript_51553/g.123536 Transcript_51553/m.123536 type:complete len:210 (-) Transcript_51553:346-975(-)